MNWPLPSRACEWLKIEKLEPVQVLDEFDGPRLFTARSQGGQLLLAYSCAEDESASRFILVPTSEHIVKDIENNVLPLRAALTQQALACIVEVRSDDTLNGPYEADLATLPESALPAPDARLNPVPAPLLRVRLIGKELKKDLIPASVVKRAVDGPTGAMRALLRYVLGADSDGRPSELLRRYSDLPAIDFAFRSFEVSFGTPEQTQQPLLPMDQHVLEEVSRLLETGLAWASEADGREALPNEEWRAIVEAMAHLIPPQKGVVERVDVDGLLTGLTPRRTTLTRDASERVGFARKQLAASNPSEVAFEGFVREFDKDHLTFWLRNQAGTNILHVSFTEEQYEDALLAFEADRFVAVFAHMPSKLRQEADLISIAFKGDVGSPLTPTQSA